MERRLTYALPIREVVSAAIAGSTDRFPVNRIFCVGRNYADHIREMGFDPEREPPFFFMKPTDALVSGQNVSVAYPPDTENFQYEAELVVAIGSSGRDVPVERALDHVWGYGVGVDLTRRDRQIEARDRGRPWELGKSFDQSAPIGPLKPASECGHPARGPIWLDVNGVRKQEGDLGQLIWSVPEVVSVLSRSWALNAGDLIFTGTPAGVGPIVRGDRLTLAAADLPQLSVTIV